jgi:hypothetical protein
MGADTLLRVADLNHDGKPDLLGFGPNSLGDIYMNDGSGGFQAPVALTGQGSMPLARFADMNGDGYPDIVSCRLAQSRNGNFYSLEIYLNDGTGNFTPSQTIPLTYGCSGLAVGDVNLDGHQDVVIAAAAYASLGSTVNNVFQTFFGDGTGNVGTPVTQQNVDLDDTSNSTYTNCAVDDITGGDFFLDGNFSLLVNSSCQKSTATSATTGTTFLGHGYGSGQFTFTESRAENEYFTDSQTVDVNQDNEPDAVFYSVTGQNDSNLYYAQNDGGGSFIYNQLTGDITAAGDPTPVQFTGAAVGNVTGDGLNDIVSIFNTSGSGSPGQPGQPYISILAGSQSGTYTESQHWAVTTDPATSGNIVAADFTGDGEIDLATIVYDDTTNTASLYVYLNEIGPTSSCSPQSTPNSAYICAPLRGSTVTSPVTVTAASNVTGFTLNRLYLDNNPVYQTTSQIINTPITAATGSHNLVLVSYNNQGQAFTYGTTFVVGSGNGGCLPDYPGVNICQPAQGETMDSPVTFTAGAIAQSGYITAIRFYVDNAAVAAGNNSASSASFQTTQSAPISAGTHQLVAVAYESNGAALTYSESFTVAPQQNCYPSSAGARICSPVQNATVGSPLEVSAGATAASGNITAIALYVDNAEQFLAENPYPSPSYSVIQSLNASPGTHNLVIVGYQSTGGAQTASVTFTVP